MTSRPVLTTLAALLLAACSATQTESGSAEMSNATSNNTTSAATSDAASETMDTSPETDTSASDTAPVENGPAADVTAVRTSGQPGSYTFAVTLRSDETGCPQYADWWEILTPSGDLIYRRILAHSHVSEQPFERSGGPVNVQADTTVVVRAHMNTGYNGALMRGSAQEGFTPYTAEPDFALAAERQDPLPTGCAF